MKSKNPKGVPITRFPLDPSHTLAQAMNRIDWALLESDELFQNGFKPIQPIRRVFGLMILETVRGLEGEQLLVQWLETPVLQYFTGETWFHWEGKKLKCARLKSDCFIVMVIAYSVVTSTWYTPER